MPQQPVYTNYIKHLNAFFVKVWTDDRLNANHISLYMALFQIWNQHRFNRSFPIIRQEVMQLSKIGSRDTYVKCLRHLDSCAYISYQQSAEFFAPSYVSIVPLSNILSDEENQQLLLFYPENQGGNGPKIGPDTGPTFMPYVRPKIGSVTGLKSGLFNKQINNSKHEGENRLPPSKKNKDDKAKKESTHKDAPRAEISIPEQRDLPTLSQVQDFFNSNQYPPVEGGKFYHHYQANGWRQGGQALILDWQAAAHKWVLNIHTQTQTSNDKHTKPATGAGRLHSNENKSYSDPL